MTTREAIQSFVAARWEQSQNDLAQRRWNRTYVGARTVAVSMPEIARAMMVCGICNAQLGSSASALIMIQRANKAAPADPMVMTRLAEALYAAGRFSEAEHFNRGALSRNTSSGEVHFLLARILWAQGRIEEASAALDIAVELDPAIAEKRRILEYTVKPDYFA
jgi:Flp pilus assembly protein TadD